MKICGGVEIEKTEYIMKKDKQFNENGNLIGFKADLERRVAHIAKVRKVSEQDVWQSMYNISLRKLTLMLERKRN